MTTMAEDNARDMKTLRLLRGAHAAMSKLNRDGGPFPPHDKACFEEAEARLEREAQSVEWRWN